ncbi:rhodanese-like domain-containing protein [Aurantiacibacter aquimixticola]|uniref:Rhodanese-like domain-containing protein n=1 Tax=Aurantiacibacter aquimixticola TaxID=1958945 RepID=A0A419RTX4_9SPHN|nr:rhodanese-like domain-containing protein [Aurantiacibacter aquimixticola]RJY09243.1 rhodanese-like domain-containing protein [Aurantiacibacter aquimixticola]
MIRALSALVLLTSLGACEELARTGSNNMTAMTDGAEVALVNSSELADLMAAGNVVLIDVRTPEEFAEGRLPGALNAPVETFGPAAIPIEDGRETIFYCRSGNRSEHAARVLAEEIGGRVRHLDGGIVAWKAADGEIVIQPER